MIIRKTTFFEKILLVMGIFLGAAGFFAINSLFLSAGGILDVGLLIAIFLWAILLFLVIIAATAENQREETVIINRELRQETKLMKELVSDQVTEIKLLRADLAELRNIEDMLKKKK
jgi:hypothetical protein